MTPIMVVAIWFGGSFLLSTLIYIFSWDKNEEEDIGYVMAWVWPLVLIGYAIYFLSWPIRTARKELAKQKETKQ